MDTEDDKDAPSLDFVEVGPAVDSSAGVLGWIDVDAEEMRTVISESGMSKEATCDESGGDRGSGRGD